ncbi:hypothetical protein RQN30_02800 [Arcanobacterium hippocoleae]
MGAILAREKLSSNQNNSAGRRKTSAVNTNGAGDAKQQKRTRLVRKMLHMQQK